MLFLFSLFTLFFALHVTATIPLKNFAPMPSPDEPEEMVLCRLNSPGRWLYLRYGELSFEVGVDMCMIMFYAAQIRSGIRNQGCW